MFQVEQFTLAGLCARSSDRTGTVPTLQASSLALDPVQLRVLGSLIEKEITSPEAYPLSLNALINACNQRSSRNPVMDLGEEQVRQALHVLEDLSLVSVVRDARVPKFEHHARTVFNLRRDEIAVLCLLLLRGPQTSGELRSRADRLYTFDGLDSVETVLNRLGARLAEPDAGDPSATGPLIVLLPRQSGARESRWAHLLGGQVSSFVPAEPEIQPPSSEPGTAARLATLEAEVARLAEVVAQLEARLGGSGS